MVIDGRWIRCFGRRYGSKNTGKIWSSFDFCLNHSSKLQAADKPKQGFVQWVPHIRQVILAQRLFVFALFSFLCVGVCRRLKALAGFVGGGLWAGSSVAPSACSFEKKEKRVELVCLDDLSIGIARLAWARALSASILAKASGVMVWGDVSLLSFFL